MRRDILFRSILFIFCAAGFISCASETARELQDTFNAVAEKAFPAVVVIQVEKNVSNSHYHPFLEQFFGIPPRGNQYRPRQDSKVPVGRASGIIVDSDGHIVTNYHVVGENNDITVILKDGRKFSASVKGRDPKTDLAVLKIEADEKFPTLKFADSEKAKVGHWAIAIGAPYNMDYSVTVGIVSQKGRSVGLNVYENYIQTDASINPGNSGGPLLNLDGEIIGINNFILTGGRHSAGNIGLAFAIPSNLTRKVVNQIVKHGEVIRPWLGISMQALNDKLKKQFKVEVGVLVREVYLNNPADLAGIEPGDVIVKIGKVVVNSPKEVQFAVLLYEPGDKIPIELVRDGSTISIKATATRQKPQPTSRNLNNVNNSLRHVSDSVFKGFGIELVEKNNSLVISNVRHGSVAELAGLKRGVKIYAVNQQKVLSIAEAEVAAKHRPDRILLYVDNGNYKSFIVLSK